MNILEKIYLLLHVIRWRLTWNRKRLDYQPDGLDRKKFITARQAAGLIQDGETIISSGFAGNARCSVFFWAIRESFQRRGHPRQLHWINVAAQGGRGKVPGTIEELGLPGLLSTYITGHLETAKAQLKLAAAGQLEIHTLPQGVMTNILQAQALQRSFVQSRVGLGTFLDPELGAGSALSPGAKYQFVASAHGELRYHLPKPKVALFNAPYADREGNIYFHHATTLSENEVSLWAVRANGGQVIATVSRIIPKDESRISLLASEVDYIVVHPYNEQIVTVPQRRYWPIFTPEGSGSTQKVEQQLKFINKLLKITPERGAVGNILAGLGAALFAKVAPKGAMVNIGVGYPEEVARILVEQGWGKDLLFTTEAGAYGGLPVPGIFFGAAIKPQKLIGSVEMFNLYENHLDVAVLGFLQVDFQGNVNASRRGPGLEDYVGPGGFMDIANGAKIIIFIGSWMANARYEVKNGKILISRKGKPKFVDRLEEITFNAREALRQNKQVYYLTHTGIFKLTGRGLQIVQLVPGIDLEREILAGRFHWPEGQEVTLTEL